MVFFKILYDIVRTRFKVGLIAIVIFIPILIIVGLAEGIIEEESESPGVERNYYDEEIEDELHELEQNIDTYLNTDIPEYEYDGSTGKTFDDIRDEIEFENGSYDYDESE